MKTQVLEKIQSNKAVIGVFGLGYVGLPLSLTFCNARQNVIGFDVDQDKVNQLNSGDSYIKHIGSAAVTKAISANLFRATTNFSDVSKCDALIVCVPTPLTPNREPDLSFVENTTRAISPYLRAGQLFCLESTTYPGTTSDVIRPILEESNLTAGKEFFLAYSPEREDPGNKNFSTDSIPKLVGGYSSDCTEIAVAFYNLALSHIVPVRSCAVAEAAKLLENIYRSVNIALVNELKVLLTRMDIDIWEVIDAAKTKPFGFSAFYPGPGLGGHCIPIDPFYLSWRARQFDLSTKFIELAGEVNTSMPEYVISRVAEALNEVERPIRKSKILVLGLSYKKDVDDLRESPSIKLIEELIVRGAVVSFNDPFFPQIPPMRNHQVDIKSEPLTKEVLKKMDLVLIATDHSQYDYEFIGKHAQIIVDTRNCMAKEKSCSANVWKA